MPHVAHANLSTMWKYRKKDGYVLFSNKMFVAITEQRTEAFFVNKLFSTVMNLQFITGMVFFLYNWSRDQFQVGQAKLTEFKRENCKFCETFCDIAKVE